MPEPVKPWALTYTEMMNGGRQQMDEAEYAHEQEVQQRFDALEKDVYHPEQALAVEGTNSIPMDRDVSWLR